MIDSFLETLARDEVDDPDLVRRLRERHRDLVNTQVARPVDALSWMHLKTALVLVAAYRELQQRYSDETLIPRLREAFVEPLRPYVGGATSASLDAAPDPFAEMVAITKQRERDFFGPSFTFANPLDDDTGYVTEVRRCFYHEVLVANEAPQLTPILCAFDATWIDVIDPARHRLRFDRPTTIGSGGASCPFTFTRTGTEQRTSWRQ